MMRGRYPSGPDFVDKLDGTAEAKDRVKVLLETLNGTCRVQEACARLTIKEARFDQVRIEVLQAAVNAAERRPAGRQAKEPTPLEAENQQLQEQLAEVQAKLEAALIRAELAVALPRVGAAAKKKMTRKRPRSRRR
jgi:DNA-binding protein YbaB